MADVFRWPLSQGTPSDQGPLLTKQYNFEDPACLFCNDFLGPCTWLYSVSGESDQITEVTDASIEILHISPVTGDSDSITESDGLLNAILGLYGEGITETYGDGLFLRVRAVDGDSENITAFQRHYYWSLYQGTLLSQGPPLNKQYNLKDSAHLFWDDFLGKHRNTITFLVGIDGFSKSIATYQRNYRWLLSDGRPLDYGPRLDKKYYLSLPVHRFWDGFIGSHRGFVIIVKEARGESVVEVDVDDALLALTWALKGNSESVSDTLNSPIALEIALRGNSTTTSFWKHKNYVWPLPQGLPLSQGPSLGKQYRLDESVHLFWDDFIGKSRDLGKSTLSLLWRLLGNSASVTDGEGKVLRVRRVDGESVTITAGEGRLIKWPLSIELRLEHLGVEKVNYIGSTVRLHAEFRNTSGGLEDPESVVLRIYDDRRKVIAEYPVRPHEWGKYRRDYTIPEEPLGAITFGYEGKIGEKVKLARRPIERVFGDGK